MLLLDYLQQFDVPPLDFFISLGALCLLLFLQTASLCAPLAALGAEIAFVWRRKAFYDKCARQIAHFACGLAFISLTLGCAFLALSIRQSAPTLLPRMEEILPLCLLPAAALFLSALYPASWNRLKNQRFVHAMLGLCAFLLQLCTLLVLFFLQDALQDPYSLVHETSFPFLDSLRAHAQYSLDNSVFPAGFAYRWLDNPAFPAGCAGLLSFGLAAGAALSQLYLFARRNKDDYGRDYYVFAMHYCARIACFCTVAALSFSLVVFWHLYLSFPQSLSRPPDPGLLLVAAGLPLLCCLLWLCIIKSDVPLRHKPGAVFACLFLFIALCAQAMLALEIFPPL
jgi:hypothetical protein